MTENLSDTELVKILSSVFKMSHTIDLTEQNITDTKIEKYLLYYTSKYTSPINLQLIDELYLNDNKLCCGFVLLFNILQLSSLRILSLSNNNLNDKGAILLAKYLSVNTENNYMSNLEYLDISNNSISHEGVKAISESLKKHKCLNELDIGNNNIGSIGVNYLGEMLKINKSINILNITDNNIDIYNSNIFALGISINKSLCCLNISNNYFDELDEDIIDDTDSNDRMNYYNKIEEVIQFILSSTSIKDLVCDSCKIDDIHTQFFANELKTNNTITNLYLRDNQISNNGAYLLFDALKNNEHTVVKYMSLANTYIDNECMSSFAEFIGNNEVIQAVDMYDTDINNEGLIELSTRPELKYNKSLVLLTFGKEDINEDEPIYNNEITAILNNNASLFWYPYIHKLNLFSSEMHNIIISTVLCNTYGNLQVRLPMEVLIYIFKFFNRFNFLNY